MNSLCTGAEVVFGAGAGVVAGGIEELDHAEEFAEADDIIGVLVGGVVGGNAGAFDDYGSGNEFS
ncbi:MAG TPA: hypothetical protein PLI09_03275 [Candidatus Hydrogenedentes bacterium]|nr:hypothetical protein [Candidatus Hydrogenedentota bacterium]